MNHPNIFDKLYYHLNRYYLYPGQLCQPVSKLNVGLVHKISSPANWKIMDYVTFGHGAVLKFLGSGKSLKLSGDLLPTHSLFEIINSNTDRHTVVGDIVALTPSDRKFLVPAPTYTPNPQNPTYYTAENQ